MKMYRSEPLTDKEKRYLRTINGTKQPFSVDALVSQEVKRVREFNAPTNVFFGRHKRRGVSGSRLDPAIRAIVQGKARAREAVRAELQAIIDGSERSMPI